MAKVSIGLRGWRFEEDAVFTEDGEFRPFEEIPEEDRVRLDRLQTLVTAPCSACWLIHGDEEIQKCNVASTVYGEPLSEVVLCNEHEVDFVYWFQEEGGDAFAGEDDFPHEFYEWFDGGGRAPESFGGIEHVETDPADVPEPTMPDTAELPDGPVPGERIDLRTGEVTYDDLKGESERSDET